MTVLEALQQLCAVVSAAAGGPEGVGTVQYPATNIEVLGGEVRVTYYDRDQLKPDSPTGFMPTEQLVATY